MRRLNVNRRIALTALSIGLLTPAAWSQAYPDKPITLVVPYPAGAAVDRVGRSLAAELGKRLGQSIVVENVGGASGTIGAKKVLRAPADGYTLLLGTVNDMIVAPAVLRRAIPRSSSPPSPSCRSTAPCWWRIPACPPTTSTSSLPLFAAARSPYCPARPARR
jgi:tripartite-type tricarboxylate transporter receptor subunit TctC